MPLIYIPPYTQTPLRRGNPAPPSRITQESARGGHGNLPEAGNVEERVRSRESGQFSQSQSPRAWRESFDTPTPLGQRITLPPRGEGRCNGRRLFSALNYTQSLQVCTVSCMQLTEPRTYHHNTENDVLSIPILRTRRVPERSQSAVLNLCLVIPLEGKTTPEEKKVHGLCTHKARHLRRRMALDIPLSSMNQTSLNTAVKAANKNNTSAALTGIPKQHQTLRSPVLTSRNDPSYDGRRNGAL